MTKNDKTAARIGAILLSLACYYFVFPNRNWAGKPYLETTNDGFAVVELFTSEGCSSCPPADELITKIQKESAGKKIYLLAFHVDYWDASGWKDRFSAAAFTQRQQQYADWMQREIIYTPQFIINGTSEFGGDDARTLYRYVSEALQQKPNATLKLHATPKANTLEVTYETQTDGPNNSLFIAVVQKSADTKVAHGENSGSRLHHVQIVRQANIFPLDKKTGSVVVPWPDGFNTNDWELIGFIQNNTTGVIRAAAQTDFK